jgi:hypothetical protein
LNAQVQHEWSESKAAKTHVMVKKTKLGPDQLIFAVNGFSRNRIREHPPGVAPSSTNQRAGYAGLGGRENERD